jgi:peptidoglycan hydrolase-like protein with peptidoglycan-binding domain
MPREASPGAERKEAHMATTAIEPLLKKGSKGDAVVQLQEALKALGFDPGQIDGIFGAKTEAAVKGFQQEVHITVDGICGEVTWNFIDEADQSTPTIRVGAKGLPVRRLQKRCTLAGFDMGGVDGRFGAKTEKGVKALQHAFHLQVDGIVGPQTWATVASLGD